MAVFINIIRFYVAISTFMTMCNMVQDYLGSANLKEAYGNNPLQVTYLTSRIMCMTHFLCFVVRATFVYYPRNMAIFLLVFMTYTQVELMYYVEYFILGTAVGFKIKTLIFYLMTVIVHRLMLVALVCRGDFKSTERGEIVKPETEKKKN